MMPKFVIHKFNLPDGQEYLYLLAENSISLEELEAKALELISQSKPADKIVLACNNKRVISELGEYLVKKDLSTREFIWGKTKHFRVSDYNWPNALLWSKYQLKYIISKYDPAWSSYDDGNALFSLMSKSFHVSFTDFSRSISGNDIYLVKAIGSNLVLGAFVLTYLPEAKEYQLHSVAGKGDSPLVLNIEEKKLPVLMSAVGKLLIGKLNTGAGLTFSSSGVAHLYEQIGFKQFHRDSLLVRKKS